MQTLTKDGIMVSNGKIIGTNVKLEYDENELFRYSFEEDNKTKWGTASMNHFVCMFDSDDKLNGLLTNNPNVLDEWYLFWNN